MSEDFEQESMLPEDIIIEDLHKQANDLKEINESHQKLNGDLRKEINDLKTVINLQKDQIVSLKDDVVKLKVEVKMLSDEAKDFNEYVQIMVHTKNLDHATEDQHKKINYLNSIHYVS
tara:strand:+ start:539 stop:892 length:354 start_codon:yes stop_codon:yes gene_type:complete